MVTGAPVRYGGAAAYKIVLNEYLGIDDISKGWLPNRTACPQSGLAVIQPAYRWDTLLPDSHIRMVLSDMAKPQSGSTIYVTKGVRTPRELYRQSGYRITLDRAKADRIVIPAVVKPFYRRACSMVSTLSDGSLQMFNIIIYGKRMSDLSQDDKDMIYRRVTESLKDKDLQVLTPDIDDPYTVDFMPDCEEYYDILTKPYNELHYIGEQDIPLCYASAISPETLLMWSKITDEKTLGGLIAGSDWKDYPVTLVLLLHRYCVPIRRSAGTGISLVLDSIGYDLTHDADNDLFGRTVEPKDWNMWMKFRMLALGLPEKGGFVSGYDRDRDYRDLRQRFAVVPMYIDHPMLYEDIMAALKNS